MMLWVGAALKASHTMMAGRFIYRDFLGREGNPKGLHDLSKEYRALSTISVIYVTIEKFL